MKNPAPSRTIPWFLITVFVFLVLCILAAGLIFYRTQQKRLKSEAENYIAAVAELKVNQIVLWRHERIADGKLIMNNPPLVKAAEAYLSSPEKSGRKQELLTAMKSFKLKAGYESSVLFDEKGKVRLTESSYRDSIGLQARSLFKEVLIQRKVILSDIHQSGPFPLAHMDLMVPLFSSIRNDSSLIGAMMLRIDPQVIFFQLIQIWPSPSRTSETLLLKQDGDSILYLNEVRHKKNAILTLRMPISDENLPSAMAIRGIEGVVEGIDYRGVPVLAALKHIYDSPWYMIAKVDREEIYAPLHSIAWNIIIGILLLILSSGSIIGFWWWNQRVKFYRERYADELERQALLKHFDHIVKYANDSILLVDMNGKVVEANDQACRMYGYTQEEFIHLYIGDIRSHKTRTQDESRMKQVEERGGLVYETEHMRKDGTVFPAEVSSRFIKIEGTRFYQSIVRDITERIQTLEILRKSEERYKNLSDLLPQAVIEMDEQGYLTFVNRQGYKTFGYTEEEIQQSPNALQLITPQDRDRAFENMKKRLNGEELGPQEYLAVKKDGNVFPTIFYANRIVQGNKTIGLNGIIIDISERKQAEEATRINEERFRRLVESVTDYIYSVKLESGRPVSISHAPACVSITGYTAEEYVADPELWSRMVHEEDKIIAADLAEKILNGFNVLPVEHRIVHKNGSIRWVKNTPVLKRDENGILIAYDGLIEDITMQKQGDEALRESEETAYALLNAFRDAAYLLDSDRRIISANEAGAQRFGKSVIELTGICIDDLSSPEISESRKIFFDQVIRTHKPVHFADVQSEMHFENSFYPIVDTRGTVTRIAVYSRDITERIKAEEAIQRERNLLRTLIDNLPDAIYVKDTKSRKTIVNPAEVRNTGHRSESEVLGKDDFDLYPKELAAGFFADDQAVLQTGNPVLDREEYVFDSKGKKRWLLTSKLPLRDEKDQIIGLVGVGRDITDRIRIEDELRQSESLFKMLVESSPVAIAVFSGPSKKLEYVSSRFAELFGYDKENISSMDEWWQLAYPVDEYRHQIEIKWIENIVEAQRKSGIADPLESIITCQDGSTKYIESTSTSIGEDTLVFFTDLTQHRLAQEALRQTHTFNDLLIQTMPFGMDIVDEEGKILFMSKAMKDMLKTDAVNSCCWTSYNDDKQQCADCPLRKGITFGRPETIETEGIFNGKVFQISYVGMMYEGKKAILEVFQDITEQKKLQQDLIQSQKLLSIGTMAGGIAHDFNNILAIILGYSSLLHSIKDNPKKFADGVTAIRQAVDRGAGLVRQILTFARKTDISFEPLNISELVKELVSMLQQTFPKIITFNTTVEEQIPFIKADHTQMHQAILNLCVNARDAMPQGGEISIAIKRVTGEKLRGQFNTASSQFYVSLSVSDNGMGMDDAVRDQIFDPFFTTKEKGKGTGLGLSVVYGIIQAHHGFVSVESTLTRGTTFTLYFPVPQESSIALETHEQAAEQITGGNETILLVEDETLLLDMVQILLESHGYTIFTAKDGEEAVQVYQQHINEIALVISDMGLPKLTGVSEFEKMKEINPDIKVIFASGFFEPDVKAALEKAGVKSFIQKPYVIDEVLSKIRRALDTKEKTE